MGSTQAIEITSNALILIGDTPISSWGETAGGIASKALYQTTKDAMLMLYPFSWALKEFKPSLNVASPDQLKGYSHSFNIPTDLLRLWWLLPYEDYDIVSNKIYSNNTEILLTYTYSVDELQFSKKFKEALEFRLAMKFAITITEDDSRMKLMADEYRLAIAQAQHIDATQKPQRQMASKPFSDVRGMGEVPNTGYYPNGF